MKKITKYGTQSEIALIIELDISNTFRPNQIPNNPNFAC